MSFNKFFDAPQVDSDAAKEKFIAHMDELKSMDVREQTLYQKWYELQSTYKWAANKASVLKPKLWRPTDIMNHDLTLTELDNLRPKLRFIPPTDKKGIEDWTLNRVFAHTMQFDQNPGRFLRFVLEDEITGQLLGFSSLGSDVVSIGCRDRYIGWTSEQRLSGMLNHTSICTTIVATQPLGYNFLGGKLMASMMVTPLIRETWKREYGETLVGLTTTSLYGDGSMYNSIPWWKSIGETMGKIPIKPTDDHYKVWHDIIKEKYPEKYQDLLWNKDGVVATGVKQKILNIIFTEVGVKISQYLHGFSRGVYFAPLYDNTKEYLRQEVTDGGLMPLTRDTSEDAVLTWWRKKATNRYENLYRDNRIKPESLFYADAMFLSWEETKAKYLGEVGR